jgi:hypothetical protein
MKILLVGDSGTIGSAVADLLAKRRRPEQVTAVSVTSLSDGMLGERGRIPCDLLLVSGGWNPAVHLFSHAGGKLRYDEHRGAFLPGEDLDGTTVTGAAAGTIELGNCLEDGRRAAEAALGVVGIQTIPINSGESLTSPTAESPTVESPTVESIVGGKPPMVLWRVPLKARRSSRARTCPSRRRPCSGTSPPATTARRSSGPSRLHWSRLGPIRIGQTVYVPVGGSLVPVEVAEPVVFDPEGSRRDG